MSQSWETLRKEARRLETEIETKLIDYSKLASSLQSSSSSRSLDSIRQTEDEAIQRRGAAARDANLAEDMTADMDGLLARLRAVVDAMTANASGAPPTLAHTLTRHTEILHDYAQEFRKTRSTIKSFKEHTELLSGAATPKMMSSSSSLPGAGVDALYAERASISAASNGADTAIATGLSLKEDLDRQRAMFASMVERMETMSEGLPAVNRLIGQIRRKKKRDLLIMAALISILLFITFSWKVFG